MDKDAEKISEEVLDYWLQQKACWVACKGTAILAVFAERADADAFVATKPRDDLVPYTILWID